MGGWALVAAGGRSLRWCGAVGWGGVLRGLVALGWVEASLLPQAQGLPNLPHKQQGLGGRGVALPCTARSAGHTRPGASLASG